MRVLLDLPEDLVRSLDAINRAYRISPPDWPLGRASVRLSTLSHELKLRLWKYRVDYYIYEKMRERREGRQVRSRTALLSRLICRAFEEQK